MNQFNASPIVKSVTSPSKHKSSHADFDNSNTLPVKAPSSTTTRSKNIVYDLLKLVVDRKVNIYITKKENVGKK